MNEHWNLEDIYPSEQAWSEDLAATRQLVDKLCAMQGRVCQDGHTLLEALDLNARCSERFAKAVHLRQLPLRRRDGKPRLQKAL